MGWGGEWLFPLLKLKMHHIFQFGIEEKKLEFIFYCQNVGQATFMFGQNIKKKLQKEFNNDFDIIFCLLLLVFIF